MPRIYSLAIILSVLVSTVTGHAGHHGPLFLTRDRTYGSTSYLTRGRTYGASSFQTGDRTYEDKSFVSSIMNQPASRAYQQRVVSDPYVAVNSYYGTSNKVEPMVEGGTYASDKISKSGEPIGKKTKKIGAYSEKGTPKLLEYNTPFIARQALTQSEQHVPKIGAPQPLTQLPKDISPIVSGPGLIPPVIEGKKPAQTYSPTDEKFVVSKGTDVEDLIVVGTVTEENDAPAPLVMHDGTVTSTDTFPGQFPGSTGGIPHPDNLQQGFVDDAFNGRTVGRRRVGSEWGRNIQDQLTRSALANPVNPLDSLNRNVWSRRDPERRVPLDVPVWSERTGNRSPVNKVPPQNKDKKKLTKYDRLRLYEGR